MVYYIERSIPFACDSDPSSSQNLSTVAGSFDSFRVPLGSQPLQIPRTAENVTLKCLSTSVWNNQPNIVLNVNDTLRVTGPDVLDTPSVFDIQITQGNYSVNQLNSSIQTALTNLGAKDGLITITPDEATQRILIRINYTGTTVDFTQANSMWQILGFTNATVLGPTIAGTSFLAPNIAAFNAVNYFLITCSLVQFGLRFNNRYQSVIAKSEITARPGSLSVNEFQHPSIIPCQHLAGQTLNFFDVALLKNDFSQANTNGETFSIRFQLDYLERVQ